MDGHTGCPADAQGPGDKAAWMGEDSDAKVPCLILGTQPAPLVAVHIQKLPLT